MTTKKKTPKKKVAKAAPAPVERDETSVEESSSDSAANAIDVTGKKVVLTGTFSEIKRVDAASQLASLGADIMGAVSKNTDLLFVGAKAGSKLSKAQKLGLSIYNESDLLEVLACYDGNAEEEAEDTSSGPSMATPFTGVKIAITGTFATMKRSDAKRVLEDAGAVISGSVSKKTELVIHGADAGTKAAKAQSLGVELMTEEEMVQQLNEVGYTHELLADAAKKLKAQAAKEKKLMAGVNKTIASVNESQVEKYGDTIGRMLLIYLEIFVQRPDVYVATFNIGAPANHATLHSLHKQVPPEILAFGAEVGPLELTWVFASEKVQRNKFCVGYNGGRINYRGLKNFRWYPRPSDWVYLTYKEEAMFDDLVDEGVTYLSYEPGEKRTEAYLVFDNAGDTVRDYLGSMELYFTNGAKAGFTWYWPPGDYWEAKAFTKRLYDASLPKNTPIPEIVEALCLKGATEAQAHALVSWLGEDVVILLHKEG